MKCVLAVLVLVGVVVGKLEMRYKHDKPFYMFVSTAQQDPANTGRALAEALEARGIALIERTRLDLENFRKNDAAHLVDALEHQLVQVEALVMDLKVQLAQKDLLLHLHHIHVIEEDLLHLENAIYDEINVINQVKTTPVDPNKPLPVQSELVTNAENLIKTALESLNHHKNTPEARSIEREIEAIRSLIRLINSKPDPAELKKDEESLVRHEKTLQQLLEKAANRG